MKPIAMSVICLALAGCGAGTGGGLFGGREDPPQIVTLPANTANADTTRPVERPDGATGAVVTNAADAPEAAAGGFLGFSVTSLGDATIPGLWLETPLVDSEQPGRVVAENGTTLALTLRPSGGERNSGSRLSLAGFQALGLSLTSLPTLTVIAGS